MSNNKIVEISLHEQTEPYESCGLSEMTTVRTVLKGFEPYCDPIPIYSELIENAADAGASILDIETTGDIFTAKDNGCGFLEGLKEGLTFSKSSKKEDVAMTGVKGTGLKNSMGSICKGQLLILTKTINGVECACIDYSKLHNVNPDTPQKEIEDFYFTLNKSNADFTRLETTLETFLKEHESSTGSIVQAVGCDWGKYGNPKKFNQARSPGGTNRKRLNYYMRYRLSKMKVYINSHHLQSMGPGFDEPCKQNNFTNILSVTNKEIPICLSVPEEAIPGGILKAKLIFYHSFSYAGGFQSKFSGLNIIRLGRQMNREVLNDGGFWFSRFPEGAGFVMADILFDAGIDKLLYLEENKSIIDLKSKYPGWEMEAALKLAIKPYVKLLHNHFEKQRESLKTRFKDENAMVKEYCIKMKNNLVAADIYTKEEADKYLRIQHTLNSSGGIKIDMIHLNKPNDKLVIYEAKMTVGDYISGVRQLVDYGRTAYKETSMVPTLKLLGAEPSEEIKKYMSDFISSIFLMDDDGNYFNMTNGGFQEIV
tara:strand:- start:685 stop:2298 length:1614 start_codon:yes stop_codon:yes gene_type:complete